MAKRAKAMWAVLAFIGDYKEANDGNPPTREDIGKHFRFSPQAADQHIQRLFRRGLLTFDDHGRVMIRGRYEPPEAEDSNVFIPLKSLNW